MGSIYSEDRSERKIYFIRDLEWSDKIFLAPELLEVYLKESDIFDHDIYSSQLYSIIMVALYMITLGSIEMDIPYKLDGVVMNIFKDAELSKFLLNQYPISSRIIKRVLDCDEEKDRVDLSDLLMMFQNNETEELKEDPQMLKWMTKNIEKQIEFHS